MNSVKLIFASAILLNVLGISAVACSYADGYLPPTKYGLIKDADAVLLAQPISKSGENVDFKVLEVLKGAFQGSDFRGEEANTSCVSYSYSLGLEKNHPPHLAQKPATSGPPKYLLFLRREKEGWHILASAAERMNEVIYDTGSSTFLTTVRHLLGASSKNNYEIEMRELRSLLQLARTGRNPKVYPKELIGFIDDYLTSPTPTRSFKDLQELYTRAPNDRKRDFLWAMARARHPEAANFFTTMLRSPMPASYVGPISEYITQTKNEKLLVLLGRGYPEMEKDLRWPLMWALIKTAGKQHQEMMLSAIRSADKKEAGRLAHWFVRHPSAEATEIVRRHVGTDYQKSWELTFPLAGMGDQGALDWAKEFMKSSHKDSWMALYTIAHSPLDEADMLAKTVIEEKDPKRLTSLIEGYKDSHNPNRLSRLRDIVDLNTRDSDVDYWLKIALEKLIEEGAAGADELLKIVKARNP